MKKIVLMLLVLAAAVTNSQWQSVGNAERILASSNAITDFVISQDGKYIYTLDNKAVISKWDYTTGDSVWSRKIISDPTLFDTTSYPYSLSNWLSLSNDALSYCSFYLSTIPDGTVQSTFSFKIFIFDLESSKKIDSIALPLDGMVAMSANFSNSVNYFTSIKSLLFYINVNYQDDPDYTSGNTGELFLQEKSDTGWVNKFKQSSATSFANYNSNSNLLCFHLSSSTYFSFQGGHTNPWIQTTISNGTYYFDLNQNKVNTISNYYYHYDNRNNENDTIGNYLDFSNAIFTKGDNNLILLLGKYLYLYGLKNSKYIKTSVLVLYPGNNFQINNSTDNNFFFVASGNSINIYNCDSLFYYNTTKIDGINSITKLKNSPDSLNVIMSDGTGYLYRTKINDIFKLSANFTTHDTIYEVGDTIQFYDRSIGYPDNYFWDFGDGSASIEKNPIHVFSDTGFFDVKLIVRKKGDSDTIIKKKFLYILPGLIANFDYSLTGSYPISVNFTNKSIGKIDSLNWNFDDGTNSKLQNPSHNYKIDGDYQVSLKVYSLSKTNSIIKKIYIDVLEPTLNSNKIAYEVTDTSHPGGVAIKGYEEQDSRIVYHIIADTNYYHGAFNKDKSLWEVQTHSGKDFLFKRKNENYAYILNDSIYDIDSDGSVLKFWELSPNKVFSANCFSNNLSFWYNERKQYFYFNYLDNKSDSIFSINTNRYNEQYYYYPKTITYSIYQLIALKDSLRYDYLINYYDYGNNLNPPPDNYFTFEVFAINDIDLPFRIATDFTKFNDSVLIFSTYNQISLFKNFGLGIPQQQHDSTNNRIFFTGTFNNFYFRNLLKLNDTAFVATGDNSGSPACIVFDSKGIVLDSFTLNDRFGSFYYVSITPDYNLLFSGYRYARKDYKSPYFVKTCDTLIRSILGSPDTFVIPEPQPVVNDVLCYPNPTNNSIAISFNLSEKATVSLKIFDYLGNPVETVPSQEFEAGEQSIELGFKQYSIGMYYYDLSINNEHRFGKIGFVR